MENPRIYGKGPITIAVIHGGPGAPGSMAPVAEVLGGGFGVMEPFQTKDSLIGQVEELRCLILTHSKPPITLIGHSWGAWLAFILAARRPELVRKLILVGSGPFEEGYTHEMMGTRMDRLSEEDRERARFLMDLLNGPDGQDPDILAEFGGLMGKSDTYDPLPDREPRMAVNAGIYQGVWPEAAEMRRSGGLLGLCGNIGCPVVAIHGIHDPTPGRGCPNPFPRV